jgi:hypothetical protein
MAWKEISDLGELNIATFLHRKIQKFKLRGEEIFSFR